MSSNELKYTEHDLLLAREMGGLTSAVQSLNTNVTTYMERHNKEHEKVWERIDDHSKAIGNQDKHKYWVYGFAAGIGTIFGAIGAWFKTKVFG